ncbi:polymorphic toxin-type HINT domain-containing protein [Streptomyces sp. B6B3]|uniref:polymorphic toxin-type HINT domain-containing protein n=1 Tax=Streptomyces sp. B6B3 TaxID=3153570 RepID=UPI00325CE43F
MNDRRQRRRARTWRRYLGHGATLMLIGSLLQAVSLPTTALANDGPPPLPESEQPVDGTDGLPVEERTVEEGPRVPERDPRAAWPESTPADVLLSNDDADGLTQAGDLPLSLRTAQDGDSARTAEDSDVAAEVTVLDRESTEAAGVLGVVFTVEQQAAADQAQDQTQEQTLADSAVDVQLDYATFAEAYGGGFGSRLGLYQLPACALDTPDDPACRERTPLESTNDAEGQILTAEGVGLDASQPLVLAAAADEESMESDYTATPLSPSGTWDVGLNTGDFTWSYDMPVPEVPGGLTPNVGLSYSSGSIDGRTGGTNNQSSWAGDGFELWPGYIERRYQSCAEEGVKNGDGNEVGDLCWEYDNAFISLNGTAGELVPVADNEWKLQQDDGTRIRRLTADARANGDNNNEYWEVTTPDGTRYYFGYHRLPGWSSGDEATDSTWTAPVYGNDSGEPCHASTTASSWCDQAWRWNLDYVVDPHGNAVAYYYNIEQNSYGRFLNEDNNTRYIRGGFLDRIDYGLTDGDLYAQQPLARVDFANATRCLHENIDCTTGAINDNEQYWYDTPWDLNCGASATCDAGRFSPTFWSRFRLGSVTTQVYEAGAYQPVDSWELTHRWGTSDVDYQLLLESIQHTGHTGTSSTPTIALPETTFAYTQLANRLDEIGDGYAPFIKERLSTIADEYGGQIDVAYSDPVCNAGNLPTPQTNTTRCFPQYIGGGVDIDPDLEWFNKYVVTSVTATDRTGGAPDQVTRYQYLGGAAWHYDDDNGLVPASEKTWSQWRGYGQVRVQAGGQGTDGMVSQQDTYFLRGMDGDRQSPSGGTKSVTVDLPAGEGDPITDHPSAQGFAYRTVTFEGVGGDVLERSVSRPWHHETASDSRDWGEITADLTGTERTTTWTSLDEGAGDEWRTTRVINTYDTVAGRLTTVDDRGDISAAADDRCTRTTYATNSSGNLLVLPSRAETVAVNCDATPDRSEDVISDERYAYDGRDYGQAPTAGDVTATAVIAEHDGSTASYLESGATYDDYGRQLTATDLTADVTATGSTVTRDPRSDGRTTTTGYSPATGIPTTVTETTPRADPDDPATAQSTTTNLDPLRGLPTKVTDTNDYVTTQTYDALGRLRGVWYNIPTSFSPTYEFTYRVTEGQPVAVGTRTPGHNGGQLPTSYVLYDGFLRERQTQALGPDGGRLLTDTFYDARGLAERTFATYYADGAPTQTIFSPENALDVETQTWTSYDGLGREIESRQVAGNGDGVDVLGITTTGYGGDRTTVIPPEGETATTTLVDARGQVTELRQHHQPTAGADFDTTSYAYTPAGLLSSVTDPAGNEWTYTYDLLGRTTATTDPDAGETTSVYDDRGQLVERTDARDQTLAYVYDDLGRQTELHDDSPSGALRAEWIYDTVARAQGQLAESIRYADGAAYSHEIPEYDHQYRATRERTVIPETEGELAGTYETRYEYFESGLPRGQHWDGAGALPGNTAVFEYDARTLWQTGTYGAGFDSEVSHSLTGKPLQYDLSQGPDSNSTWVNNTYEWGTQRLASAQVKRFGQDGWDRSEAFTYDEAGNVLSAADVSRTGTDVQCFAYDYLRRLTEAWAQGQQDCADEPSTSAMDGPAPYWHSYTYDAVGNRLTENLHEQDTERTYDYPEPGAAQPHTLTSVTEEAPGVTSLEEYDYDASGNTTSRQTSGDTQTLTWDAEGNLTRVEEVNGGTTEYVYDTEGNRLIGRTPTETTLYLGGHTEVTLPNGSSTPEATRYFDLGGGHTAVHENDGDVFLTIADHHGTAQLAVNAATLELEQRRTLPFGDLRGEQPASWPGTRGFVGGTSDTSTGLTHLGAREYDPAQGRFVSLDPIMDLTDPQQIHGYTYANNNPLTFADPSGELYIPVRPDVVTTPGNVSSGQKPPKPTAPVSSSSTSSAVYSDTGSSSGFGEVQQVGWNPIAPLQGMLLDPWEMASTVKDLFVPDPWGAVTDCQEDMVSLGCSSLVLDLFPGGRLFGKTDEALDEIGDANRRSDGSDAPSCNSFVPGTHVLMADGTTKPIEDVEIGDEVLATDPETGETIPRTVTAELLNTGTKQLTTVTLTTEDGATETLTSTDEHPYWTPDTQTWTNAESLNPGDHLTTPDGTQATVTTVQNHTQPATVHNLTIQDTHTYYVVADDTPVLVHNCNFRPGAADEHYDKHVLGLDDAGEPTRTPDMPEYDRKGGFEEYVADACSLMCGPLPAGAREATRSDGVVIRLDASGRIGMRNGEEITTFFRPDDPATYFSREAAR